MANQYILYKIYKNEVKYCAFIDMIVKKIA